MSAAHNVAINVQPLVKQTTFVMVSILFDVISKSFMVLKFMFKIMFSNNKTLLMNKKTFNQEIKKKFFTI